MVPEVGRTQVADLWHRSAPFCGKKSVPLVGHNPGPLTGAGTNTWLLDGSEPALVDAAVGAPAHLDEVAARLGGRPLVRLLVTHGHPDHAGGVAAFQARWPGLEVCRFAGPAGPDVRRLADQESVRAGDSDLIAIHTPGHAADHLCFWEPCARDLYAGDMLVEGGTVVVRPEGGGLRAYLASLQRLAALRPARVLPGHGPVVTRPLERIQEYLDHRRERERQVLSCLADGLTAVDDIVSRIYPDLAAGLRPAARLTVEAHLDKLREEKTLDPLRQPRGSR